MSNLKPGDYVTNKDYGRFEPFKLESSDFKGISAKSKDWFKSLKRWKPKEGDLVWYQNQVVRLDPFPPNKDMYVVRNIYDNRPFGLHRSHIKEPFIGTLPTEGN